MITPSELRPTTTSGNIFLDTLTYDTAFAPGAQITYVLQGKPGEGQYGGQTWANNGARAAFAEALASWSAVANIKFIEAAGPYSGVGNPSSYDWIEAFATLDEGIAGQHDLPLAGTMRGEFANDGYFTEGPLVPGSIAYATFVHEIGHGLGLEHPHNDDDEPAGDTTFPGVSSSYDIGSNGLNQGIYTVMTYNSGYGEVGIPSFADLGWEGGPMAFDIAAVQRIYGANMTTNVGNSAYTLPDANEPGTAWLCIWDGGGDDTLAAAPSSHDSIIDLRAATLLDAPGGGGFVSRTLGVLGGYTIANGVVIENARGGSGDDRLHGNAAANRLDGGAGYDTVDYSGVKSDLVIDLNAGLATGDGTDTLTSIEAAIGGLGNDRLVAFGGANTANGAIDVIKRSSQDIGSRDLALDLDNRFGDRNADPTIAANAGMVSASVKAEGGSGFDFYSFFVDGPGSIIIDIDESFGLDTVIKLYDAKGTLLASNDDGTTLDAGSANDWDSFLVFKGVSTPQRLFVEVSDFDFPSLGLGNSYRLNVSLATARVATGTQRLGSSLDGGGGDDTLVSGAGNDRLSGGAGNDIAVFSGASTAYTIKQLAEGSFLVESTTDGSDTLDGIEAFAFADGRFTWSPTSGLVGENRAPSFAAPSAKITAVPGKATTFTVSAVDPDGNPLTYVASTPAHGTVTGGAGGGFTYTMASGYRGGDSFTVTAADGSGASAQQTIVVEASAAGFRMFAGDGFVGAIGGSGTVFGTNGVQRLTLYEQGSISFDPSFNRGGDAIVLPGAAGGYTVSLSGSSAMLSRGDAVYLIPVGTAGTDIVFDDGSRRLIVDSGSGGVKIGDQTLTGTAAPLAAPAGSSSTGTTSPAAQARVFLEAGAEVDLSGRYQVFGTAASERLALHGGSIELDPSFNRGGDVLVFDQEASDFSAVRQGSSVKLSGGGLEVVVPIGTTATTLAFAADDDRLLVFDQALGEVRIGQQTIASNPVGLTDFA